MGQSYRVRTGTGVNQQLTVQLDQEFEFLEILSLRIQQEEIYNRNCANYGVIVGRVTANNGFGLPNARVSVFIPITSVDQSNPIISSIYPYKSPTDKNEDGFRYNLLPYEKSYSKHAATGTLPTRNDVLTGQTAIEIYDTYYKYTTKTNESGDYMIMGAPLGPQTIFMDVDLSDIGEFSLTPQDLIRMGLATEAQVAGNQFKSSNDLNSLPQIISLTKKIEVSPLWGDETVCQIAINRVDFDLRDEANVDIQPTSVFMGSMFSAPDKFRVRKNCKPRDNLGNLCNLDTGPGQILAIRQTIQQDDEGNPIIEQYQLEQAGNVIDGNGAWLTELPMNLDYVITNEFGEKVISNDPTIGIPTKGKYRFKVKWQQSPGLTEQTRRAYYLVPNVREFGWNLGLDPNYFDGNIPSEQDMIKQQKSSYYFGLDWSGYTQGLNTTTSKNQRINEIVDCNDTFYQFNFNKVYTISSLIDQYKKGARGRFIGIKEIDDDSCSSTVNKFPVNDGFRNFDFLFFIFSLLLQIVQVMGYPILVVAHIVTFLYSFIYSALCEICGVPIIRRIGFCRRLNCQKVKNFTIRFPMITYPECQACDCKTDISLGANNEYAEIPSGSLSYFSFATSYLTKLEQRFSTLPEDDIPVVAKSVAQAIGGNPTQISNINIYKLPQSEVLTLPSSNDQTGIFSVSNSLPLGERLNVFNQRSNYFTGINSISVKFSKKENVGTQLIHYDSTLTLLSNTQYSPGELLTFVNPFTTKDVNYNYSATTINGVVTGINGTSYNSDEKTTINVTYLTKSNNEETVTYTLPYGSTETNYKFPMDREYFQVVTAITVSEAVKIWSTSNNAQALPNILTKESTVITYKHTSGSITWDLDSSISVTPSEYFDDYENQYIIILQRGVDPYSPVYENEYGIGKIFGFTNESDLKVTTRSRINIPIQKLPNNSNISVQSHSNQTDIFYQSYFFKPGIDGSTVVGSQFSAFTTSDVGYYGALDSSNLPTSITSSNNTKVYSITANDFYDFNENPAKYGEEDLSSISVMYCNFPVVVIQPNYGNLGYQYYSKSLYPQLVQTPMQITQTNSNLNVMRTDRAPTSDALGGYSWELNPSILQQNLNFTIYKINTDGVDITSPSTTTGASQVTPDLGGQPLEGAVLASFNCERMVGLKCYSGNSYTFGISTDCEDSDAVENGCYMFLRRPIKDLFKDFQTFAEWGFRFRFFYGLCRGVLSQSFMNNWINGTLYAFPIQTDTYYDSQNKPYSKYCQDLIYFDKDTYNYYYRSSPYNGLLNKFVGKDVTSISGAVNKRNLLFPTTIINLGPKDSFYKEITFDPANNGYLIESLNPTSYGDTSDLVNLFVISRITDEGFFRQLFAFGDNSLDQLFSRDGNAGIRNAKRIDGDLAQAMSINSEVGVIKFSPEFYETTGESFAPIAVLGSLKNPTMGIFFSSTTNDLQVKDFITPGVIDFRDNNSGYFPYPYGIKTQEVPFYQWRLNTTNPIFGDQYNDWSTDLDGKQGIISDGYQNLSRMGTSNVKYFLSTTAPSNVDTFNRGYIFSVQGESATNFSYNLEGTKSKNFLVGAPFHFYFGVIKGQSALDKFKTKYSVIE